MQDHSCRRRVSPVRIRRTPERAFEILADRYLQGRLKSHIDSFLQEYSYTPEMLQQQISYMIDREKKKNEEIEQKLEKIRSLDALLRR